MDGIVSEAYQFLGDVLCRVSATKLHVVKFISNKKFYIVKIIFIILELIKKYKFFISHADGCHSHVWKVSFCHVCDVKSVLSIVLSLFVFTDPRFLTVVEGDGGVNNHEL